MRKAGKCEFIKNGEQLVGVVMTGNFCSEHEWGIDKIKAHFGIGETTSKEPWWKTIFKFPKPTFGIDKRTITRLPSGYASLVFGEMKFELKEYKKKGEDMEVAFLGMQSVYGPPSLEKRFADVIKAQTYEKKEAEAWWSEENFLFSSTNKEFVKEIYKAFLENDIAMWTGTLGNNPFSPGGFIIAIKSKIPQEQIDEIFNADEDYYNLQVAAESTGIYEKLEKAGKSYYALSPRWKDKEKKEISFWLNPNQQNIYESGWYGVKELEQWIKNEGPIIKVKK